MCNPRYVLLLCNACSLRYVLVLCNACSLRYVLLLCNATKTWSWDAKKRRKSQNRKKNTRPTGGHGPTTEVCPVRSYRFSGRSHCRSKQRSRSFLPFGIGSAVWSVPHGFAWQRHSKIHLCTMPGSTTKA